MDNVVKNGVAQLHCFMHLSIRSSCALWKKTSQRELHRFFPSITYKISCLTNGKNDVVHVDSFFSTMHKVLVCINGKTLVALSYTVFTNKIMQQVYRYSKSILVFIWSFV